MLGKTQLGTTRPQPPRVQDPQPPRQLISGYAPTRTRSALEMKPGGLGKIGCLGVGLVRGNETCSSGRKQRPCKIVVPVQEPRQTEIANKWLAAIVEQNVSGFKIAMEHSAAVSVFDRARDLRHE